MSGHKITRSMMKLSRRKIIGFFGALAVILLLIFFGLNGWLAAPKNVAYFLTSPFLKAFQWSGGKISNAWQVFFTLKNVIKENAALSEENSRLLQENILLKEAARENSVLRERLGLNIQLPPKTVLANVIGRDFQTEQFLLIDKGEADGLTPGLAVVTANNFLVGKITEVQRSYAKIILITDGNSSINAFTQETRVSGVIKGVHGLQLVMEMIPVNKDIKSGETILTSGNEKSISQNLIIGNVADVVAKENEIFKQAIVRPAADFDSLEKLFVLIP